MEVFFDFGLFEILAVSGLAALGRLIYRRQLSRWIVLILSVVAPAVLLVVASTEAMRWIAAVALGTSLVNSSVIAGITRQGRLPEALAQSSQRKR
jgi:hypothetical protein